MRTLLAFVMTLGVFGCSTGDGEPVEGSGGGASDAGGAGTGGANGSGGDVAGTGGIAPDTKRMTVQVTRLYSGSSFRLMVTPDYVPPAMTGGTGGSSIDDWDSGSVCESAESGACSVSRCTLPTNTPPIYVPDPNTPLGTYRDAGTITATFTATAGDTVAEVIPDADGEYDTVDFAPKENWVLGNEPGSVSASGGEIPSFSRNYQFPLAILARDPTTLYGGTGYVLASRAGSYTLRWDRGIANQVVLLDSLTETDPTYSYDLRCSFDAEAGEGVIDASVMKLLPLGGRFKVYSGLKDEFVSGDTSVTVYLVSDARTADKLNGLGLEVTE